MTKILRTEYDKKAFAKSLYDDGKAEGDKARARKTALLMIQDKEDPVKIQKYTEMSMDQIEKLMKESKRSR